LFLTGVTVTPVAERGQSVLHQLGVSSNMEEQGNPLRSLAVVTTAASCNAVNRCDASPRSAG
jgi:hypothetical protein